MNGRLVRTRRSVAAAVALMAAACAAPPPKPAPPAAPLPLDASYDWHALLIAPFGSSLKEFPSAMHEVLLFRDQVPGPPTHDEPECYAVEREVPRFMARSPAEYLVCFTHDRLSRIEATVQLSQTESAQIFDDACGLWTKNAPAAGRTCNGADGTITFAAHLESDADAAGAQLVIQLDSEPLDR